MKMSRVLQVGYTHWVPGLTHDEAREYLDNLPNEYTMHDIFIEDEDREAYFTLIIESSTMDGKLDPDAIMWSIKACQVISGSISMSIDQGATLNKDEITSYLDRFTEEPREWAKHLNSIKLSWAPVEPNEDGIVSAYSSHVEFTMTQYPDIVFEIIYI